MKLVLMLPLVLFACLMEIHAQTAAQLAELWEKEHATTVLPSNVRHKDLQKYLDGLKKLGVKVEEVGRSYGNREIYQIEWGSGPLKILLWSQMHGDEPTATSALIDLYTILQKNRDKSWIQAIEKTVTLRAVPMLNPDGAELYIRRNLQGIDINRDARDLVTPEAQLLKRLRDEWLPEIGFNLHNQNALTTAGATDKQAAISFLVVYGDAAKTPGEGYERNKRLVSAMTAAVQQFIPGHVGRYDDGFAPTAFGDNFSAWGTPAILIETGALHGNDEMFLVKMNFVAILMALRSLADGTEKALSPANYDLLPNNTSGRLVNIVFRGASIVDRSSTATFTTADLGLITERRRQQFSSPATIRQIGDLSKLAGLDEYDASNFYLVGRFEPLRPGVLAELLFYKKSRQVDWTLTDLEKQSPPDAVFSVGKWIRGEGVVPRIR